MTTTTRRRGLRRSARGPDGGPAAPRAALALVRLLGVRPPPPAWMLATPPTPSPGGRGQGARCPPAPRALARAVEDTLFRAVELPAWFAATVEAAFPGERKTRERIYAAGEGELDREGAEWAMVAAFRAAFERRYFPLSDLAEDFYSIGRGIPFEPQGFEWDDLEDPSALRDGFQALVALVDPEAPGAAARADLLHSSLGVTVETLVLLPREPVGWETLEARFGGGPRAAVLDFARWLAGATGCVFLDATFDDAGRYWWDWSPESVRALAAQWAAAEELVARVYALAEWLEADLPSRLRELLILNAPATEQRGREEHHGD